MSGADPAAVRVVRARRVRHGLAAFHVEVDGEVVAKVRNGADVVVPLSPGPHRLRVLLSWAASPELAVAVPERGEATVAADLDGGLLRLVSAPRRYLRLTVVPGPADPPGPAGPTG